MKHVFAVLIGLAALSFGAGAVIFFSKYPQAGVPILVLISAYCLGRGLIETIRPS